MLLLTLQMSFCGFLVAMRDLKYQFYCYYSLWIASFIPVYVGIGMKGWQGDKLWMITAFENLVFMSFFIIRLRKKKREEKQLLSS